jgi:hypothetical protein
MGENYLHEQVENSKKRRDKTRQDLERPKLLSRPEVAEVVYNVVPAGKEQLQNDEILRAVAVADRLEIDVLRHNLKIATIQGDGARKLHAELSQPENGGVVSIRINNVSELSGCADAQLIEG